MVADGAAEVRRVAIVGAGGRMGTLARRIVDETEWLELHAAIGSADQLDAMDGADLAIDFTLPQVSQRVAEHAIARGIPLVIGTSGWSAERIDGLRRPVSEAGIGVVIVPNFSVGSVLGSHLAQIAARHFDSIEIVEGHHAGKTDSPSGTATRTAEMIGAARRELGPVSAPHVDQRARGQQIASVPVHSLRLQGLLAKQEVHFGGTGEVLTITHDTYSPDAYVSGIRLALAAAPSVQGVLVGLDALLGLQADDSVSAPVAEGAPSGQTATTAP